MFYFKIYIILSMSSIFLSFAYSVVGQWTGARARRQLHEEAVSRLLRVPMSFFESHPVGKILNRFSADMGVIDKVSGRLYATVTMPGVIHRLCFRRKYPRRSKD